MRARFAVALTAAMLLFLLEAQRVLLTEVFGQLSRLLDGSIDAGGLATLALPFVVCITPLVPLSRMLGRERALLLTVGVATLARIAVSTGSVLPRLAGAAITIAAALVFFLVAVGFAHRRSVATGAVIGFLLDRLLWLAGRGYDPTVRVDWLPYQIVIAVVVLSLLAGWYRAPEKDREPRRLERRAGGLRLRGAVAFGVILFFEARVLTAPIDTIAAGAAAGPAMTAAVLSFAAGALALCWVSFGVEPRRHRALAAAFAILVLAGALASGWTAGWSAAVLFAAGSGAALALLGRVLAPASGRRSGWTLAVGMFVFFVLATLHGSAAAESAMSALVRGPVWVVVVAGVMLAAAVAIVPRPSSAPPFERAWVTIAVGAGFVCAGVAVTLQQASGVDGNGTSTSHIRGSIGATRPIFQEGSGERSRASTRAARRERTRRDTRL